MSLPRYPKYKSTGVAVLPQLPEHWDLRPLRQLGRFSKGSGGSKEDIVEGGVPCVRYGDLYTTHSFFVEAARTSITAQKAGEYTPIQYGDVLFAASGEKLEEIGKAAVNLIKGDARCGGDLIVLRPRGSIWPRFIGYAADSSPSNLQKASMGRGTTVKHIYPDELRHLLMALPPAPEQRAIAAFLDRETAKIDDLVAEQEHLVELLKEKRQAVISHAVTKGLNSGAHMKDSGVEWLGQMPSHWRVVPLRRCMLEHRQGYYSSESYVDQGIRLLRITDIRPMGRLAVDDCPRVNATEELRPFLVEPSDFLFARTGGAGLFGMVENLPEPAVYASYLIRFRFTRDLAPAFLRHYFLSAAFQEPIARVVHGGVNQNIHAQDIKSQLVAVPPLPEQRAIASYLDSLAAEFGALVTKAERATELLHERRTALISAAVTGQIDVRPESMRTAA